jgi:RNA polymerase sigma factor (sigma-70 family)
MPIARANLIFAKVRRASLLAAAGKVSDGTLLTAFLSGQDDASFEMLVRRHAAMVWGVCLRVIGHRHDAEDAFQATFLVLARKAASVRPREAVGNWLYGVAYRTARRAKAVAARRAAREKQVNTMPQPTTAPADRLDSSFYEPLLDEELSRLPDKYRLPLILCELEGQSRKDVARQLNLPEGTLSSRLAVARKLLGKRLMQRGVTLSALLSVLSGQALASVPAALVSSTGKAATAVVAGRALTTAVSPHVVDLTEGVLKTMLLSKLKIASALLLLISLVGLGLANLDFPAVGEQTTATKGRDPNAKRADRGEKSKPDHTLIQGTWQFLSAADSGRQAPEDQLKAGKMVVTKDRIVLKLGDEVKMEFTYRLDPSQKPKWIDLTGIKEGNRELNRDFPGIYELDGDTLKLVWNEGSLERPSKFTSEPGRSPNDNYWVFKRDAAVKRPVGKESAENPIEAARQRVQIEEQRLSDVVEQSIRRVRSTYVSAPKEAYAALRGTLLRVWDHPDIGERVRGELLDKVITARRSLGSKPSSSDNPNGNR